MSNLLVQNIKHTNGTTAQTVDTSGRTTVSIMNNDSTYRSDGGAVTQNMVQGLAKAWADYTGNVSGSPSLTDTFNVATLTDHGAGDYTHAYTNAMASANHVFTGCAVHEDDPVGAMLSLDPKSNDAAHRGASSVRVASVYGDTPTYYDYRQPKFVINGDLA